MFEATCDRCGGRCEVPFRPNGEKPVFCRACFGKNDGGRVEQKPDQSKMQFDILNAKLDRIIKALAPAQPQKEEARAEKPMKEAVVPEPKKAPSQQIAVEGKPTEDAAAPKTKKTAGKKAPAKKAAKIGK